MHRFLFPYFILANSFLFNMASAMDGLEGFSYYGENSGARQQEGALQSSFWEEEFDFGHGTIRYPREERPYKNKNIFLCFHGGCLKDHPQEIFSLTRGYYQSIRWSPFFCVGDACKTGAAALAETVMHSVSCFFMFTFLGGKAVGHCCYLRCCASNPEAYTSPDAYITNHYIPGHLIRNQMFRRRVKALLLSYEGANEEAALLWAPSKSQPLSSFSG